MSDSAGGSLRIFAWLASSLINQVYPELLTTKKFLRSIPLSMVERGVTKVSAISEAIDILGKKELGKSYWTGIPYCMKSAVPVP